MINQDVHCSNLNFFEAVNELLHIVVHHGTAGSHENIAVSIKTAKTLFKRFPSSENTLSLDESLFYIKVSSTAKITRDCFEELSDTSALLHLLSKLETFENESHLCLQHCFKEQLENTTRKQEEERQSYFDSHKCDLATERPKYHSMQQNLKLCEGKLVVQRETWKTKKLKGSVIYLRVLASSMWMMKECRKIHSFLSLLRVFRPRSQLSFYMKVGGAISETEFRVANWKRILGISADMVTDINYFLQDSCSSGDFHPVTTEPRLLTVQALTSDNTHKTVVLQLVAVAVYVPVDASLFGKSCVTLTIYGQDFTPLQFESQSLLTELDWTKYGMKISEPTSESWTKVLLPHHCVNEITCGTKHPETFLIQLLLIVQPVTGDVVKDFGLCWMNGYLPTFLSDQRQVVLQTLSSAVDKALKPENARLETRRVVEQSIKSACSAITDIICLSGNNSFRESVFKCMQVKDSVELKEQLQCRLTSISHRRHSSVWGAYSNTHTWQIREGARKDVKNTAASSNSRSQSSSTVPQPPYYHQEETGLGDWFEADQDQTSATGPNLPLQRDHASSGKNAVLYTIGNGTDII